MPQLLLVAAAAVVGIWGYRKFISEAERVSSQVRRQERETANQAQGTLVEDPETGEYRPVEDEEQPGR